MVICNGQVLTRQSLRQGLISSDKKDFEIPPTEGQFPYSAHITNKFIFLKSFGIGKLPTKVTSSNIRTIVHKFALICSP